MRKTIKTRHSKGFSLVEIMFVVIIIGLLATLAIQNNNRARREAHAARLANDFRVISQACTFALQDLGDAPRNGTPGRFPPELKPYLPAVAHERSIVNNGLWDWENFSRRNNRDYNYGVSFRAYGRLDNALFQRVDEIIDDGNLGSGQFRRYGRKYTMIIEGK